MPIVAVVTLLPITVSGLGVREGMYAMLFSRAGASIEEGALLGLLIYGCVLVSSLPGGIWLARWRRT